MVKKVVAAVLVLVAAFLGYVGMQPSNYRVERTVRVAATPEVVFPLVANLEQFPKWSPWQKLDPDAKRSFDGKPGEPGSSYLWEGNDDVGMGKMTVAEVVPNKSVKIDLQFMQPWESLAVTGLQVKPAADGVDVVWWMDGQLGFGERMFTVFADLEGQIGASYEEGLTNLKGLAEAAMEKKRTDEAAAKAAAEAAAKAAADAAALVAPAAPR